MKRILSAIGRFIAGCVGVLLGLTIAIAATPWIVFNLWEWLAKMGF